MSDPAAPHLPTGAGRRLARYTFISFLLTFIAARTVVILIMARRLPDLFLHLGGTHVHHLNYGIFLLSTVGGLLLFATLNRPQLTLCAIVYGCGMALTFDEYGMWLHLGGSYWQRASFDAVIVILSLLGVIAFAPPWRRLRSVHFISASVIILVVVCFYLLLIHSLARANDRFLPNLIQLENQGPK